VYSPLTLSIVAILASSRRVFSLVSISFKYDLKAIENGFTDLFIRPYARPLALKYTIERESASPVVEGVKYPLALIEKIRMAA
jgi:hypothetical protein